MSKTARRFHIPSVLAAFWLTFSVSLAGWWLIFGLKQIDRLMQLQHQQASELARQQRMVMWEGSFLIVCLIFGGSALLYYIHQEGKRSREIREFFATFTHELKTSLASLRLQSESLEEDLRGSGGSERILGRLVKDTVRLELQLENSLFLAHADASRLVLEDLAIKKTIQSVQRQWPGFVIRLDKDAIVRADERALESILKNIVQNSVVHGQATELSVAVQPENSFVKVLIKDNGRGFKGDTGSLGRLFHRHYTKSGSGVGLYLARELMKKMGGELRFLPPQPGFGLELKFRGRPA